MLPRTALVAASLAAFLTAGPLTAQATKSKRKPRSAKAPAADPSATPKANTTPAPGVTVLRTADCVLGIRGDLTRDMVLSGMQGDPTGEATNSPSTKMKTVKHSVEHFAYEIPGTLVEEMEAKATAVRFRFIPAVDMVAAKAQGQLHFEDKLQGSANPPIVMDASEITGADTFLFQAEVRGGQIVPVSGNVYLRGIVQGDAPTTNALSMRVPQRPVISSPLPTLRMGAGRDMTPPLRFTGISLWAWPNSKAAFTVAATLDYAGPGPQGTVTGHVEVSFRVGDTK